MGISRLAKLLHSGRHKGIRDGRVARNVAPLSRRQKVSPTPARDAVNVHDGDLVSWKDACVECQGRKVHPAAHREDTCTDERARAGRRHGDVRQSQMNAARLNGGGGSRKRCRDRGQRIARLHWLCLQTALPSCHLVVRRRGSGGHPQEGGAVEHSTAAKTGHEDEQWAAGMTQAGEATVMMGHRAHIGVGGVDARSPERRI